MHFLPSELRTAIDSAYLDRGLRYQQQGRVISAELQQDGSLVAGMVRGSRNRVYKLLIRLHRTAAHALEVTGQCSCPVHYNCKHVAAVLYEVAASMQPSSGIQGSGLPPELCIWLDRLQQAGSPPAQNPTECLLYLLDLGANQVGRLLRVNPVKTRRLKNGGYGATKPFAGGAHANARLLQADDQLALGLLEAAKAPNTGEYQLRGALGARIYEAIIDTGRCLWNTVDGMALRRGPTLQAALEWDVDRNGQQTVCVQHAERSMLPLPLAPPWYLDCASGETGPLDTGLPEVIAETLAAAPPVPHEQVDNLTLALHQSVPGLSLPTPRAVDGDRRDDIAPLACLRLKSEKDDLYYPHEQQPWSDYAEFWYDYDGLIVHPMDEEPMLMHRKGDNLMMILRHVDTEIDCFEQLLSCGLEPDDMLPDDDNLPLRHTRGDRGWIGFMLDVLPALHAQGWRIDVTPSFRFKLVEPGDWYASIDEPAESEWFSLELGVEVDGEQVNLLPILAAYLRQIKGAGDLESLRKMPDDTPLLCPLGDGRVLKIPLGRGRHVIDVLTELYEPDALEADGRLRLSRYQSSQLGELAQANNLTWEGGDALRQFAERLRACDGIPPCPPPETLHAQLRPYQQEGLDWLQFLREHQLGGILADDMGLGKTVQALAHILVEKAAGRADRPTLVVAPTSLMFNWRREAERFAPQLRLLTLQGLQRKRLFEQIADHDLVLTTYPLLPRDAEILLAQPYHLVILDEAQHIKNPRAKAAEIACRLNARHRICLTGTPLENHLGELWSQFNFLMPGLLGDEKRFRRLFRTPIEKHSDETRRERLVKRIGPFMLRREKADVVADLPPKTEIISEVELSGAQRDLYETIRVGLQEKVQREIDRKGIQRSQIIILDALLKLRQVCCDPRLLKMDAARKVKQSAKLELLREMLGELVQEGRRILLFSQFTSMLGLIEDQLTQDHIDYVKLTGRTRDRATPIDRFQAGQVPIFLISLKAGGAGLNLTAADTVIHYDPWWNPAVERQATDRAHRIGQDKKVFVYKLLTRGTVEEKIAELQTRKQQLADALFGAASGSVSLKPEDLEELFSPLN